MKDDIIMEFLTIFYYVRFSNNDIDVFAKKRWKYIF